MGVWDSRRNPRTLFLLMVIAGTISFTPAHALLGVPVDGRVGEVSADRLSWNYGQPLSYGNVGDEGIYYIGTVFLAANISLDERDSFWYQVIGVMDGPPVKGTNKWNCVDDNGGAPNSSCTGGWQQDSNPFYSNELYDSEDSVYHSDNSKYWYDFDYKWYAAEWTDPWSRGKQASGDFTCSSRSGSDCRFNTVGEQS